MKKRLTEFPFALLIALETCFGTCHVCSDHFNVGCSTCGLSRISAERSWTVSDAAEQLLEFRNRGSTPTPPQSQDPGIGEGVGVDPRFLRNESVESCEFHTPLLQSMAEMRKEVPGASQQKQDVLTKQHLETCAHVETHQEKVICERSKQ
eukprot:4611479-Amphidinium_carterae.1